MTYKQNYLETRDFFNLVFFLCQMCLFCNSEYVYIIYKNNSCISKMQNSVHFIVEREKAKAKKKNNNKQTNAVLNVHGKIVVVTTDHTFQFKLTLRCQSRCFLSSTGDVQTSFRDWLVGRRRRALEHVRCRNNPAERLLLLSITKDGIWRQLVVETWNWILTVAFSQTKMPIGIFHEPPARNVN